MLTVCLLPETRLASQVMFSLCHVFLLYLLFHFVFLASPLFSDPDFLPLCVSHLFLIVCTALMSFTFVQLSVPPLCIYATFMRWSHFLSSEVVLPTSAWWMKFSILSLRVFKQHIVSCYIWVTGKSKGNRSCNIFSCFMPSPFLDCCLTDCRPPDCRSALESNPPVFSSCKKQYNASLKINLVLCICQLLSFSTSQEGTSRHNSSWESDTQNIVHYTWETKKNTRKNKPVVSISVVLQMPAE